MGVNRTQPDVMSHESRFGTTFSDKHTIFKIWTVAGLCIASLFYGVTLMNNRQQAPATAERKETMFLAKQKSVVTDAIPPIDASAPAKTETATFALG